MKGESDIISGLQALKRAHDHWDSFIREKPGSLAERMFGMYIRKINWIVFDFLSCPHFPEEVRRGIRKEWTSDTFAIPAISEKVALLSPDQREAVEAVIDLLLSGEKLEIEVKPISDDTTRES